MSHWLCWATKQRTRVGRTRCSEFGSVSLFLCLIAHGILDCGLLVFDDSVLISFRVFETFLLPLYKPQSSPKWKPNP